MIKRVSRTVTHKRSDGTFVAYRITRWLLFGIAWLWLYEDVRELWKRREVEPHVPSIRVLALFMTGKEPAEIARDLMDNGQADTYAQAYAKVTAVIRHAVQLKRTVVSDNSWRPSFQYAT